jgi:hypothetical protein
MKKISLVLFVLTLFATVDLLAQSNDNKAVSRLSLGFTAGIANNYFTNEQPLRANSIGYAFNLRGKYKLKKNWGIQAEVIMASSGGKLLTFRDDTYLGFEPTITFKNSKLSDYHIHNVELAIAPTYNFKLNDKLSLDIYAGPSVSILYNEWESYQKTGFLLVPSTANPSGIIGTITNRQFVDYFEPYWFNIVGGANVSLSVSKRGAVVMDYRFANGITPVKFGQTYVTNNPLFRGNIRTNNFRLSLGYQYTFNKRNKKG